MSTASRNAACSGTARPPARAQASTASMAARLTAAAGAASGRVRQNAAAAAAASVGVPMHSGHSSAGAGDTVAVVSRALCSRYAVASSPERVAAISGPAPASSAAAAQSRQHV